ncbi:MAG: hypothetical protein KF699_16065 [Phycisphaeraceae bacterium]|nr:hypothetical protein [Phycisphaeraceae bacterium]
MKDRDVPGVPGAFGSGTGARRMAERIPPEVLREALGALLGDDAAPDVRADEALARKIRGIEQEYRAAQRAYMAEHREEMIELRREANLGGRGAQELDRAIGRPRPGEAPREPRRDADVAMDGSESPMMGEVPDEQQAAARQRLRQIMEGAPRVEDFATRVWESLAAPQRAAVEARLDEWRAAEAKRREEAYVRQRAMERERNAPAAQPESAQRPARRPQAEAEMMQRRPQMADGQAPERPNVAAAQRRERLMRLFERLSPEQQENMLQRLENALRDGTMPGAAAPGPARGRAQRAPADAAKPAPSMDGVEVPDPAEVD